MTIDNNKQLMRKAFIEAMCEKYSEELARCNENAVCSAEHKKRIRQIISSSSVTTHRKRFTRRTVVALLIAAALLLAGCTAYVYREQIGNFFVEIFDEYIVGEFDNGKEKSSHDITDIYTVGYLPNGYTLQKETVRSNIVTYTWQNESMNTISFDQTIYDKTIHYIDGEKTEVNKLQCDGYMIYSTVSNSVHTYLWDNGEYVFTLRTTYPISKEEIIKIIESINIKQ